MVRTLTSAISAGTELLAFRGQIAPDTVLDESLGAFGGGTFAYPFRYGYASVGEVTGAGAGVEPGWLRRRVFAFEPHASAFVAAPADVVPVPEGLNQRVWLAVMRDDDGFVRPARSGKVPRELVLDLGHTSETHDEPPRRSRHL